MARTSADGGRGGPEDQLAGIPAWPVTDARRPGGDPGEPSDRFMRRLIEAPETNVAIFAFLLNLVWELAQVPLFAGMPTTDHWRAILVCGRATLGDVVIVLVAFGSVAVVARSRNWVLRPTVRQGVGFVAAGVVVTIIMEGLATRVLHRWAYAEAMPVLPILGVGLSPLLQWLLLPPLVLWFVRRQLT
jgi:hypothetical protein